MPAPPIPPSTPLPPVTVTVPQPQAVGPVGRFLGSITGDGTTTSFPVNHGLGTSMPAVHVRDILGNRVDTDSQVTSANALALVTVLPLAPGVQLKYTVIGAPDVAVTGAFVEPLVAVGQASPMPVTFGARAAAVAYAAGILSVSAAGAVSWTSRITVANLGVNAGAAADGYFDITVPTSGTVIPGYGGAASVTVSTAGITLAPWTTLYYALPIGAGHASVPGSFAIMGNGAASQAVPPNWIPVCALNGATSRYLFLGSRHVLGAGDSIDFTQFRSLQLTGAQYKLAINAVITVTSGTACAAMFQSAVVNSEGDPTMIAWRAAWAPPNGLLEQLLVAWLTAPTASGGQGLTSGQAATQVTAVRFNAASQAA